LYRVLNRRICQYETKFATVKWLDQGHRQRVSLGPSGGPPSSRSKFNKWFFQKLKIHLGLGPLSCEVIGSIPNYSHSSMGHYIKQTSLKKIRKSFTQLLARIQMLDIINERLLLRDNWKPLENSFKLISHYPIYIQSLSILYLGCWL